MKGLKNAFSGSFSFLFLANLGQKAVWAFKHFISTVGDVPMVVNPDAPVVFEPDPDPLAHVFQFNDHLYSFPAQNANALHSSIV